MRVIAPDWIDKLYDLIEPYMEYREGPGWVLREDAPPEIVVAREKIKRWNDSVSLD